MSADPAASPLQNAKHEAVLQAYVADKEHVGWRAYVSVYPKSSEAAAATGFSRLLRNAGFAARLKFLEGAATEVAVEKSGIEIAAVVNELAKIGFANAKNYLQILPGGEPAVDLSNVTDDQFAALSEVTVEHFVDGRAEPEDILEPQPQGGALQRQRGREVRRVKFKLHNKHAALVSILEHLGGFPARKHELTGRDGGPIETEDKTERSDLDVARRIAFVLAKAARGTIAGGAPAPDKPEDADG